MRAAIVATLFFLSMGALSSSAFADDYAATAARCAKDNPGDFAAQMACIQRERSEPSRSDDTTTDRPQLHSVTKRFGRDRAFGSRTLED